MTNADEVVEKVNDIICIHLNDMVAETNLISHGDYLRKWAMKLSIRLSGVLVPRCPDCDGQGWYSDSRRDGNGEEEQVQAQCERCYGKGFIESNPKPLEEKEEPNGAS